MPRFHIKGLGLGSNGDSVQETNKSDSLLCLWGCICGA